MNKTLMTLVATVALTAASGAMAQTATTTSSVKEVYVTAQPTDVLSSNLLGLNIKNSRDETIGEIKDLVVSEGRLAGYVVSVGGFLGIGERYVVVSPKAIKVNYATDDKKWGATMETTKEALTAAPSFKYDGRWAR